MKTEQRVTATGPLAEPAVSRLSSASVDTRQQELHRNIVKKGAALSDLDILLKPTRLGSQGASLTLAKENNKCGSLYRLTLKTVPM